MGAGGGMARGAAEAAAVVVAADAATCAGTFFWLCAVFGAGLCGVALRLGTDPS